MANLSKVSPCFYLGLAGVVAGLAFLRVPPVDGFWSLTLAPALLILAYLVLVPAGMWPRHAQTAADRRAVAVLLDGNRGFANALDDGNHR